MQIWSGNVRLDGNKHQKELQGNLPFNKYSSNNSSDTTADLHLHTSLAGGPQISTTPNATLTFLSFVDIANIPLYLFAGPSLHVYTNCESTEAWLSKHLLASSPDRSDGSEDNVPWWTQPNAQSEIGVLLQFSENSCTYGRETRVTEVLIYAAMQREGSSGESRPLTPPRSSSPAAGTSDHVFSTGHTLVGMRVYAQLISSAIQDSIEQFEEHARILPSESSPSIARFLTPPPDGTQVQKTAPGKRLRVETLFDDAARQTKKVLKRGGESVAKVMAGINELPSQLTEQRMSTKSKGDVTTGLVESPTVYKQPPSARLPGLSRSMSMISPREFEEKLSDPRFTGPNMKKRSSLNCVTSLASIDIEGKKSPVPEDMNPIERQNKDSLTKVIMAGMRLYGFESKRKANHGRSISIDTSRASTPSYLDNEQGDEAEYKNMYHQTFKAAAFVFRRSIRVESISQQLMRDIVDRLLALFCNDPVHMSQSIDFA